MVAQWLWHTGLVAPRHMGSSQTKDRTRVPCIDRQIRSHWTTKDVHRIVLNFPSLKNSVLDVKEYVERRGSGRAGATMTELRTW